MELNRTRMSRDCVRINEMGTVVWGHKIIVITDHRPLQYLSGNLTCKNARLTRWNIFLQAWDITQYRQGRLHANADCLSRLETD